MEKIMSKYRTLISFHFKPTLGDRSMRFIEKELMSKGRKYNCHKSKLWQDEAKRQFMIWEGSWGNMKDVKKFLAFWKEFVAKVGKKYWTPGGHKTIVAKLRAAYRQQRKLKLVKKTRLYRKTYGKQKHKIREAA